MAIIVGIVSAVVIAALGIGFFLANGMRTRARAVRAKAQPQGGRGRERAPGID